MNRYIMFCIDISIFCSVGPLIAHSWPKKRSFEVFERRFAAVLKESPRLLCLFLIFEKNMDTLLQEIMKRRVQTMGFQRRVCTKTAANRFFSKFVSDNIISICMYSLFSLNSSNGYEIYYITHCYENVWMKSTYLIYVTSNTENSNNFSRETQYNDTWKKYRTS